MTRRPRRGYRLQVSGGARAALTAFLLTSVAAPAIAQTRPPSSCAVAPVSATVNEPAMAGSKRSRPGLLSTFYGGTTMVVVAIAGLAVWLAHG